MSSTMIRSTRVIRRIALVIESSARCRRTRAPRSSMLNQATVRPESMASWPRASQKWLLPVPDGPQTHRFSCRSTHSRVRSACWVGTGMEQRGLVPDGEGLAGGEVRPRDGASARWLGRGRRSPRRAARAAARRGPSVALGRWDAHRRRPCAGRASAAGGSTPSPPRGSAVRGCGDRRADRH